MVLKKRAIVKIVYPIIKELGYSYLNGIVSDIPIVFAKKVPGELYLFLLIGRVLSENGCFSIEMSLSPSTNAGLTGRDIPVLSSRRLEDIIPIGEKYYSLKKNTEGVVWTIDMISNSSSFAECVSFAELSILRDSEMIEALRRSKKLLLEVQVEKWVISWYHEKEESQLSLEFLQYTPKEGMSDIPLKWFLVAEEILMTAMLDRDKKRVYSLAIQSYWKDYLDSLP